MLSRRDGLLMILGMTLALPGVALAGGDGGGRRQGASSGGRYRPPLGSAEDKNSGEKDK